MYNITPIIEAVITLIIAIITCVAVPYIRSHTTLQQQTVIMELVKIAVAAAEQIFKGYGQGAEKKEYVVEWLKSHGVTVDAAKLDAMIESAVYELNKGA